LSIDFDLEDLDNDSAPDVSAAPPRPRPNVRVVSRSEPTVVDATETTDEQAMAEVEFRLELAQYYRLVLSMDSFFSDSTGPAAAVVDKEIRDFVRTRMSKLVGVENTDTDGMFTPAEITALKALAAPAVFGALKAIAAKVTKKPSLVEPTPEPVAPTLKKANVPAKPALRKVSAKSVVQSASTPAPQTPAPTPTPTPTPVKTEQVGGIKRVTKTVMAPMVDQSTGKTVEKEVVIDLTQQSRPTGSIQPIPFPTSIRQIEMTSQMTATRMAEANSRRMDAAVKNAQ